MPADLFALCEAVEDESTFLASDLTAGSWHWPPSAGASVHGVFNAVSEHSALQRVS